MCMDHTTLIIIVCMQIAVVTLIFYIILDTSGSIPEEDFEMAKNFMADLISGFNIGENNVRVGLVLFGSTVYPIFDLDDSYDKAVILSWIRYAPYYDGGTANRRWHIVCG